MAWSAGKNGGRSGCDDIVFIPFDRWSAVPEPTQRLPGVWMPGGRWLGGLAFDDEEIAIAPIRSDAAIALALGPAAHATVCGWGQAGHGSSNRAQRGSPPTISLSVSKQELSALVSTR